MDGGTHYEASKTKETKQTKRKNAVARNANRLLSWSVYPRRRGRPSGIGSAAWVAREGDGKESLAR